MTPYYQDDSVTIYHGDALWLIPEMPAVDAIVTDPPYSSGGMFRGDRTGSTVAKYVQTDTIAERFEFSGDNRDQRAYLAWVSLWMGAALQVAKPGASACIFSDWRQLPTTTDAVQAGGWIWRGIGVWDKTEAARPRSGLSAQAEYAVWATAGPVPDLNVYLPGVFRHPTVRGANREHITEKPLELMRWLARLAPVEGIVLDPFAGSGTTLMAAKSQGRKAIGIEIEERYCEIAANRCRQEVLGLAL